MPEFPTGYPAPEVESSSSNEQQLPTQPAQPVLRKPWLHLIIFSIVNALLLAVLLAIVNAALLSSLPLLVMSVGIFVVPVFGINFSSIHLVLLILDIFLAALGFFFIYRKLKVAIPKTVIVIVIGVLACSSFVLPHYIAQTQEKVTNPVQVGAKNITISDDDTILSSRKSAKDTVAISDNAVIWVEHTKQAPPHNNNAWDLFLFTFDKDSGRGETVQLTDTDKAVHKTPDTAIIDGGSIYWTVDAKLYKYAISTRKQEVIREKTSGIYGINGNVALVSGLNEDQYGGVSVYDVSFKGLYLVNLSTKAIIQDVTQYEHSSRFTGTVGPGVYCPYDYDTGVVSIISLAAEPKVIEAHLPYVREYSNEIVTCSTNSVVFTSSQGGLRMYDVKTAKVATIDSSITGARAKLIDGMLYFVGKQNHKLQKYNPQTNEIRDIVALPPGSWSDHQRYWDMHQGYMVYLEQMSEFQSNLHLRRLPEANR